MLASIFSCFFRASSLKNRNSSSFFSICLFKSSWCFLWIPACPRRRTWCRGGFGELLVKPTPSRDGHKTKKWKVVMHRRQNTRVTSFVMPKSKTRYLVVSFRGESFLVLFFQFLHFPIRVLLELIQRFPVNSIGQILLGQYPALLRLALASLLLELPRIVVDLICIMTCSILAVCHAGPSIARVISRAENAASQNTKLSTSLVCFANISLYELSQSWCSLSRVADSF